MAGSCRLHTVAIRASDAADADGSLVGDVTRDSPPPGTSEVKHRHLSIPNAIWKVSGYEPLVLVEQLVDDKPTSSDIPTLLNQWHRGNQVVI
jgi:hypothetical protein